jgi:hypothetical protein
MRLSCKSRYLRTVSLIAGTMLWFGLWASENPVESTTATSAAPSQVSEQAAPESSKTSQPEEEKTNPLTDWKPPEMPEPAPFSTQQIDPDTAKALKEQWGVELLGIRRTAAGNFLDFRFRVLDADKALPLFDHRIKPQLIVERSNVRLPVPMAPKVGAFRPTNRGNNIKPDKIYYMIFGNPDRYVKMGEKVTVVIGDFKVEHLLVN